VVYSCPRFNKNSLCCTAPSANLSEKETDSFAFISLHTFKLLLSFIRSHSFSKCGRGLTEQNCYYVIIKASTANKYAVRGISRVKFELRTNVSQTSVSMSTLLEETEEISETLIFLNSTLTWLIVRGDFRKKNLSFSLGERKFPFSENNTNKYLNVSVQFNSCFIYIYIYICVCVCVCVCVCDFLARKPKHSSINF
jgi:hypothetical protein